MIEYRVTKYNPAFRDSNGAYKKEDWTAISDIGREFSGVILTAAGYQRVEDAYVAAAESFLREAGQSLLEARDVEARDVEGTHPPAEGSSLALEDVGPMLRAMLRERVWCRLENEQSFVHVGYDYYMYIGVPRRCPESEAKARELGLFVERFPSPYRD